MNSASDENVHLPVLSKEVLDVLQIQASDTVLDCTVGSGGHAKAILGQLRGKGMLIGLDRDASSLGIAKQTLASFTNIKLIHGNFRDATALLEVEAPDIRITKVLLDLGFSTVQIGSSERGFSFQHPNAPLDMRFDQSGNEPTAADLLNRSREQELCSFFRDYGEEPRAEKLAREIVATRRRAPFQTVGGLLAVVARVKGGGRRTHNPATTVFQALRIAVNDELGALEEGLPKLLNLLPRGGRIAVITFHSLEDRIAKRIFKAFAADGAITILTKHVIKPSREEQKRNPRSRSAKLRIAEKVL